VTKGPAERVAHALLYEGYLLYPYRTSAAKNRFRWTLGSLYPCALAQLAGEPAELHAECLVLRLVSAGDPRLDVSVRFLQLAPHTRDGAISQAAVERRLELPELRLAELATSARARTFDLATAAADDFDESGLRCAQLQVRVTVVVRPVAEAVQRIAITVRNLTAVDERALSTPFDRRRAEPLLLASANLLLSCRDGQFVSLLEPPPELAPLAEGCRNIGVWPVLVGTEPARDCMLASPIILYDYPAIAPESSGDHFDATEIDELLRLRLLTLAEPEKAELRAADPRTRELLERAEGLSEEGVWALHGARRDPPASGGRPALGPGERVRLCPRPGRDAFDHVLRGEPATIIGCEQDLEGRAYYTVTLDNDPGRDLGLQGFPGHRFFFEPDEVEKWR
jgi:hypothetical protein